MSLKKFEQNDLFLNVMKTNPHCKFSIYNGKTFYKQDFAAPVGFVALFDLHLDAPSELCSYSLDFSQECNSQYIPLL